MATDTAVPLGHLPGWLKPMNRVIVLLQRLGMPIGPTRVLSVPGRKSGRIQVTPVSPLTVEGRMYVVAGIAGADWAKNARVAGWGVLAHGRRERRVVLRELPPSERGPILREFPRLVPGGVGFFRKLYPLPDDPAALPEAFSALADRATVFLIEETPHR